MIRYKTCCLKYQLQVVTYVMIRFTNLMQPAISQARPHRHLFTDFMGLWFVPFKSFKNLYKGVSSCSAIFVSRLQNEQSFLLSPLSDHNPRSLKYLLKALVQQNTRMLSNVRGHEKCCFIVTTQNFPG